jgi:hypothetical protein
MPQEPLKKTRGLSYIQVNTAHFGGKINAVKTEYLHFCDDNDFCHQLTVCKHQTTGLHGAQTPASSPPQGKRFHQTDDWVCPKASLDAVMQKTNIHPLLGIKSWLSTITVLNELPQFT